MSDPRFTDPYDRNSQLSDPVLRRDQSVDSAWGWIAGIAVVVLIAFIVIAGWNSSNNTASNGPAATTGTATRSAAPPSTVGRAPPAAPAPAAPAAPAPAPAPAK
jgi:hypothetical protein